MSINSQSRKWALVINQPQECGLTHEVIIETLMKFSPQYFCLADEIATTGTLHTHIFIYGSPMRFSTIKGRFPTAHIEKAVGSAKDNRDYITKSGKWENTEKSETSVTGSFYEYGTLPPEQSERHPEMYQLIQDLSEGKRTAEIVEKSPNLAFRVNDIDALRQTLLSESHGMAYRNIEVTYLYGKSGAGKTRSIYQKHPMHEICRITSYRQNGVYFDAYHGQDVLVFEDYNSQIPIEDFLGYIDIYPVNLPARYKDRVAAFSTVYITSNISLYEQYVHVQHHRPEIWQAFLRRIHRVIEFRWDGTVNETILNRKGGFENEPK